MSLRRHARFLAALAAGLAVGALTRRHDLPLRMLLAGDTFFLLYLLLTAAYLAEATASHLRERAARADEGLPLIVLVTLAAAGLNVGRHLPAAPADGRAGRRRPAPSRSRASRSAG